METSDENDIQEHRNERPNQNGSMHIKSKYLRKSGNALQLSIDTQVVERHGLQPGDLISEMDYDETEGCLRIFFPRIDISRSAKRIHELLSNKLNIGQNLRKMEIWKIDHKQKPNPIQLRNFDNALAYLCRQSKICIEQDKIILVEKINQDRIS